MTVLNALLLHGKSFPVLKMKDLVDEQKKEQYKAITKHLFDPYEKAAIATIDVF